MIPFPGLLVPLATFFATDKADGVRYTDKQRDKILRWFWRSLFTRRFSAGVNQRQATDIIELRHLRNDENYTPRYPAAENRIDFKKSPFSSNSANGRILILMLNTMEPKSFLSGAKVVLDEVLKKGSKHEYHHIFPQRFLDNKGFARKEINVLANICFLTRGDNNSIKDKSPADYLSSLPKERKKEYLSLALCPEDTDELDYDNFINARVSLLNSRAEELML
jgi:hypothetical protein